MYNSDPNRRTHTTGSSAYQPSPASSASQRSAYQPYAATSSYPPQQQQAPQQAGYPMAAQPSPYAQQGAYYGATPGAPTSRVGGYTSMRAMENQNDDMLSELHHKTSALKQIALNMGEQARDDVKYFTEMHSDMGRTGVLLKNTMNRLTRLMNTSSPSQMCYLILFILFVFFVLYWMIRR